MVVIAYRLITCR